MTNKSEQRKRQTTIAVRKLLIKFATDQDEGIMENCAIINGVVMMDLKHFAELYGCTVVYIKHAMKVGFGMSAVDKVCDIFDITHSEFYKLGESE